MAGWLVMEHSHIRYLQIVLKLFLHDLIFIPLTFCNTEKPVLNHWTIQEDVTLLSLLDRRSPFRSARAILMKGNLEKHMAKIGANHREEDERSWRTKQRIRKPLSFVSALVSNWEREPALLNAATSCKNACAAWDIFGTCAQPDSGEPCGRGATYKKFVLRSRELCV